MSLSVLQTFNPHAPYGLFDGSAGCFIQTGEQEALYAMKHEIEQAEQQEDNRLWAIDFIQRHYDLLRASFNEQAAERRLAKHFPKSYAAWKAAQVSST